MDWDRKSTVIWLEATADDPEGDAFESVVAVKWPHAIQALHDIYRRSDDPVPPTTQPWMLWEDGTVFSPTQIMAVRQIFEDEVEERGGALAR